MYVTDALYAIDTHRELQQQWSVLVRQKPNTEYRNSDDIVADVIARAGLKVNQGGVK